MRFVFCFGVKTLELKSGFNVQCSAMQCNAKLNENVARSHGLNITNTPDDPSSNRECVLTDIPVPKQLPQPCSIQHLVEHFLDIQGVPRRYFFELLSHFTTSDLEKEKLQEFCSAEGQVCRVFIYTLTNHSCCFCVKFYLILILSL